MLNLLKCLYFYRIELNMIIIIIGVSGCQSDLRCFALYPSILLEKLKKDTQNLSSRLALTSVIGIWKPWIQV